FFVKHVQLAQFSPIHLSRPGSWPIDFHFLDAHSVHQTDVRQIRSTAKACLLIHQISSNDLLAPLILSDDFDHRAETVVISLSNAQTNLYPTVIELALIDEELIGPPIGRPHPPETRIDILFAIIIKIEEDDAVAFLDRAKTLKHGNVRRPFCAF